MAHEELRDEVGEALVSDVEPDKLEAYGFARGIMPVFGLVRSLFSQNELDTCLKLMVLYELSRAGGRRFNLESIRRLVGFLDGERADALVRSLYAGGWLQLRASDHTYSMAEEGLHLLGLLHAADMGSLTPANALARAAQNAAFGATLDGATGGAAYLLDQLLVLLENQVEEARHVLSMGRPYRLIAWSRREHGRQLEIIRGVLGALQEKIDAASREFSRVVRIHEAIQEIVRAHGSIHERLREWNLDRLHTSEAGYSISELAEAVLGADDATLVRMVTEGLVQAPLLPPSLTTDEVRMRFHAARRRSARELASFVYLPPATPELEPWSAPELDPASALRQRLTDLLARREAGEAVLALEDWLKAEDFAGAAYELATLCRLCNSGPRFMLDDGREATVHIESSTGHAVAPEALLEHLVSVRVLRPLEAGLLSDVRIFVSPGEGTAGEPGGGVDG